jgi:hypothetical protein
MLSTRFIPDTRRADCVDSCAFYGEVTAPVNDATATPVDFILLVDTSTSMVEFWLAVQAAVEWLLLRAGLGEHVRFALVTFNTDAQVIAPLQPWTAAAAAKVAAQFAQCKPDGITNMGDAIELAFGELRRTAPDGVTRSELVIVLTDGEPSGPPCRVIEKVLQQAPSAPTRSIRRTYSMASTSAHALVPAFGASHVAIQTVDSFARAQLLVRCAESSLRGTTPTISVLGMGHCNYKFASLLARAGGGVLRVLPAGDPESSSGLDEVALRIALADIIGHAASITHANEAVTLTPAPGWSLEFRRGAAQRSSAKPFEVSLSLHSGESINFLVTARRIFTASAHAPSNCVSSNCVSSNCVGTLTVAGVVHELQLSAPQPGAPSHPLVGWLRAHAGLLDRVGDAITHADNESFARGILEIVRGELDPHVRALAALGNAQLELEQAKALAADVRDMLAAPTVASAVDHASASLTRRGPSAPTSYSRSLSFSATQGY